MAIFFRRGFRKNLNLKALAAIGGINSHDDLQLAILKELSNEAIYPATKVWTQETGGQARMNRNGTYFFTKNKWGIYSIGKPDICLVKSGRFGGLEVKFGSDRLRDEQKAWRFGIERAGGKFFEVRSLSEAIEAWKQL